jgi:hypothetical protein
MALQTITALEMEPNKYEIKMEDTVVKMDTAVAMASS